MKVGSTNQNADIIISILKYKYLIPGKKDVSKMLLMVPKFIVIFQFMEIISQIIH